MKINYYVNLYSLSAHDYFYGEQPLAGFASPVSMVFAITLSNDSVILSKFGLQGTADLTALIAIKTFTGTLTGSALSGITNNYYISGAVVDPEGLNRVITDAATQSAARGTTIYGRAGGL